MSWNKIKTGMKIILLFKNWPTFFVYYFGFRKKKDMIFRFRNGLKWHVDATKRGFAVISDVWVQQPYRLINKIKNPRSIIDLGAHIGSFSIMAATKFPNATIYSFDASKENFQYLKKNISTNRIKNIKAFNEGVGDKNTILNFLISEKNTVYNTFLKERISGISGSYKVRCRKLSTIFSQLNIKECDFLKLDVEGYELRILKSALKDGILSKIKALAAEIPPGSKDFKETITLLSKHGFRVIPRNDIISAIRN